LPEVFNRVAVVADTPNRGGITAGLAARILVIFESALPIHEGVRVAIYRTIFYGDITVGTGGRMTIPLSMRDRCGIQEGDTLTVRVEENPKGIRQLVMWRRVTDPED